MTYGEKKENFCGGLNADIRIEVLKSAVSTFKEAFSVKLSIESALWGVSRSVNGDLVLRQLPMNFLFLWK